VEDSGAVVEIEAGVRELAKEPGERDVGALVVLLRAKDTALACCSKLSSATARWRPSRAPGSRGARKRGQRGGGIGLGQGENDAWRSSQQEVARRRRQSGGQRRRTAQAAGGGGRADHVPEEEEERGGVRGTRLEISRISGTSW
jgi:hypothetical protein